ncbi:GNAT family acetyltransferase (macronuclear) [Tetrahymena thermophila SB210]|uniref:GNAT family acetyltransferase n=1 Tax=Tetrahymena thermophila (strain SB210) TaxID=312017 RepID=Q239J2_TETTS|nr:GNAT family acetyltransferase [Tetrahymena thermophila SB210]EAR93198.1 GNAT family acetyltransferase [Tetrahymena thermophila SB210]|eukprot:XP_001013443.1 GNAT family acetyltransferase [Tetrahymena thermophila SB210]
MVQLFNPGVLEDEDIKLQLNQTDLLEKQVPCYFFDIICKKDNQKAGSICLRTKFTYEEEFLWGNMGFVVEKQYQGKRFAFKASKLLINFARRCGMKQIYFTVDPTNIPSIKTITNLGAYYLETIDVPKDSTLYNEEKCQYCSRFCLYI